MLSSPPVLAHRADTSFAIAGIAPPVAFNTGLYTSSVQIPHANFNPVAAPGFFIPYRTYPPLISPLFDAFPRAILAPPHYGLSHYAHRGCTKTERPHVYTRFRRDHRELGRGCLSSRAEQCDAGPKSVCSIPQLGARCPTHFKLMSIASRSARIFGHHSSRWQWQQRFPLTPNASTSVWPDSSGGRHRIRDAPREL